MHRARKLKDLLDILMADRLNAEGYSRSERELRRERMIHALRIGRKKHVDGYVYLLHIAPHAKLCGLPSWQCQWCRVYVLQEEIREWPHCSPHLGCVDLGVFSFGGRTFAAGTLV